MYRRGHGDSLLLLGVCGLFDHRINRVGDRPPQGGDEGNV
uniref:Uncharacterized protein n=1 Tax=Arundo donax TaxID=35708 RepID=A0A0A8XXA5_ARUDO